MPLLYPVLTLSGRSFHFPLLPHPSVDTWGGNSPLLARELTYNREQSTLDHDRLWKVCSARKHTVWTLPPWYIYTSLNRYLLYSLNPIFTEFVLTKCITKYLGKFAWCVTVYIRDRIKTKYIHWDCKREKGGGNDICLCPSSFQRPVDPRCKLDAIHELITSRLLLSIIPWEITLDDFYTYFMAAYFMLLALLGTAGLVHKWKLDNMHNEPHTTYLLGAGVSCLWFIGLHD